MMQHILVPTDGSELCNAALEQARELASRLDCRLTVLHVVSDLVVPVAAVEGLPYNYPSEVDSQRRACDDVVKHALAQLAGVQAQGVVREANGRSVADVIVQEADALNADLIVMSTHCRKGIRRLLEGSVAEAVLHHARQPVLLTHEAPRAARGAAARDVTGTGGAEHQRPLR